MHRNDAEYALHYYGDYSTKCPNKKVTSNFFITILDVIVKAYAKLQTTYVSLCMTAVHTFHCCNVIFT